MSSTTKTSAARWTCRGRSRKRRLVAGLDVMPTLGGFVKSKQRIEGLRWAATDVDSTFGDGPEVSGPAEALLLLASGRPTPLDEVTGEGVATFTQRLGQLTFGALTGAGTRWLPTWPVPNTMWRVITYRRPVAEPGSLRPRGLTAPRGGHSGRGSGAAGPAPTSCVRRAASWWRGRAASARAWRRR